MGDEKQDDRTANIWVLASQLGEVQKDVSEARTDIKANYESTNKSLGEVTALINDLRFIMVGNYVKNDDFDKYKDKVQCAVDEQKKALDKHVRDEKTAIFRFATIAVAVSSLISGIIGLLWQVFSHKTG